jgi:hypothetical protein
MRLKTEIAFPVVLVAGILNICGVLLFSAFIERKQKEDVALHLYTIGELEA